MLIFDETHSAVASSGPSSGRSTRMHQHRAQVVCDSGLVNATVVHYGRNSPSEAWEPICTFTFTSAANGEKQVQSLEHAWEQYKSECTSISGGVNARVLTTMSGA